jgi:hypothetical protein
LVLPNDLLLMSIPQLVQMLDGLIDQDLPALGAHDVLVRAVSAAGNALGCGQIAAILAG